MRKIITLILMLGSFCLQAQMDFEGSQRHGVLSNFEYDHQVDGIIYASIENKILKSSDNGENWSVIYSASIFSEVTNLHVLNDEEMVFQEHFGPSLMNNIAVLNLQTNSISKRIDMPDQYGSAEINHFDIKSDNSDVVFLNLRKGNREGYGMYTNDAGGNWSTVYVNEDYVDNISITSLALSDINPEKLVITRKSGNIQNNFEGGGVWISEDAGETWEVHLENILLRRVAINPEDDDEILAGSALRGPIVRDEQDQAVYRTTNNGEDWSEIDVDWYEGWGRGSQNYITGINFNPHEHGNIMILTDTEMVSTIDDGDTWNATTYPGGPAENVESYFHAKSVSFDPFEEGKLLINNNYYPLKSEDGGITSERFLNPFYPVTGDVSIYNDDNETHIYHGVQHGYVHTNYITKEETDIEVFSLATQFQIGPPLVRLQVDKTTPGRMFIYTTYVSQMNTNIHLELSEDYGETKEILYENNIYRYVNMRIDPSNNEVLWLSLEDVSLNPALVKVDFSDMNNISSQEIELPASGKLYSIEVDPNNSSNVYIAMDNKIYFSEDNANTWEDITNDLVSELNSPQDYILSIKNNPLMPTQYSLATNKGVFTTNNNGNNWEKLNDMDIVFLEHSTVVDGHMVGMVYSSEELNVDIIVSVDHGETWEVIENEDLNEAQTNNMADAIFYEESIHIFIGTSSLGLIGYEIDVETMGVDDFTEATLNTYKVHPNPTQSVVKVQSKIQDQPPRNLTLYSMQGQKLKQENKKDEISLSDLETGMYILEVENQNNKKENFKIIKE